MNRIIACDINLQELNRARWIQRLKIVNGGLSLLHIATTEEHMFRRVGE